MEYHNCWHVTIGSIWRVVSHTQELICIRQLGLLGPTSVIGSRKWYSIWLANQFYSKRALRLLIRGWSICLTKNGYIFNISAPSSLVRLGTNFGWAQSDLDHSMYTIPRTKRLHAYCDFTSVGSDTSWAGCWYRNKLRSSSPFSSSDDVWDVLNSVCDNLYCQ